MALPKGGTFNAEYYRDNILTALTQLQPEDDESWLEETVAHWMAHWCGIAPDHAEIDGAT
jgi:NADH:ubiquinone oxidoreductase subunit E